MRLQFLLFLADSESLVPFIYKKKIIFLEKTYTFFMNNNDSALVLCYVDQFEKSRIELVRTENK